MKVLEKKDNGLCKIEYYDKISKQKIIIDNVNPEVVAEIKLAKKEEDNYRKFAKKHLVSLDELVEMMEIEDDLSDPEAELMEKEDMEELRDFRYKVYHAMRKFSLRERQIARLRFYENKINKDIAQELGISEPRVTQISKKIEKILKNL